MKRAWRWIKRLLLGVFAVAVVAIVFVLIAVHTDWGRGIVKDQVETILVDVFPGGATIARIDGSPFGTLVLTDVVLNGPDKQPLVHVAHLEIEASILPLVGRTVHVDRVLARGVTITNPRAPKPPEEEPPESPWTIELPAVVVEDAAVHIDGKQPTDIDKIRALATLHVAPRGGDVSVFAFVAARWQQREVAIGGLLGARIGDAIAVPFVAIGVGDAYVVAHHGRVDPPAGSVLVSAPARTVARLAPGVVLPADAWVTLSASTTNATTSLTLRGAMGTSHLHGTLTGEIARPGSARPRSSPEGSADSIETLVVRGVLSASDVDFATLTKGAATGRGTAMIGVAATEKRVRATVLAAANVDNLARDLGPTRPLRPRAMISIDATREHADAIVLVAADGEARIAAAGAVGFANDTITIGPSWVGVRVANVMAASGLRSPAGGQLVAEATANGPIGKVAIAGWYAGTRLRLDTIGVADARGGFSTTILHRGFSGSANAVLTGITNRGKRVGRATVDARTRADRRIAVSAHVVPVAAPLVADVSAIVALPTPEGVIAIELEKHRVALPNGVWAGAGGTIRIDPRTITVADVRSASGDARVTADAVIGRGTNKISAKLVASGVELSRIDKKFRGTFDGNLELERKGIRWKGGGKLTAHGIALGDDSRPVDASVDLAVDGRRVKLGVRASNPEVGGGRLAVVVDGPRDLTDIDAWSRVARSDLHGVTIGLDTLNARALTHDAVPGVYDGTIEIREGVPDGTLRARGIPTMFGTARADLSVALDEVGFVDIKGDASIGDLGDVTLGARIHIPDRPFDIAVYKRLGRNLVNGASVRTSDISVTPALLAKLGIVSPYSGLASAEITIGTGGSSVEVTAYAKQVTGGPLRAPIDATATVRVDDKETTANLRAGTGRTTLVELSEARTPVSLDRWIAWGSAKVRGPLPDEAVTGTLTIPQLDAPSTLALVGRSDVIGGTLEGKITVAGTLRVPTAKGTIDLANVAVRPRMASRKPAMLKALHVDAAWTGAIGKVVVTGEEVIDGKTSGTLLAAVSVDPRARALVGSVKIKNFEISPVTSFLPGLAGGSSGKLDVDMRLAGLDPVTGKLTRDETIGDKDFDYAQRCKQQLVDRDRPLCGFVQLADARIPLPPILGTLRKATARIELDDGGMTSKVTGTIGGGTIELDTSSDPRGIDTSINAKVTKLSPIGFLQPQVSATAKGTVHREGLLWTGKLAVRKGLVFIPKGRGNELLDDSVPDDLLFVDDPEVIAPARVGAPKKPFLVLDIDVGATKLEMPEFVIPALFDTPVIERGNVTASGSLRLAVGTTIGMTGQLHVDRGDVTILGREYTFELGRVAFDGTLDPLFDVKLSHEFDDVTTYVRFAGRVSTIDSLEPELTSDPGTYSQGQLFGFLLGGTPDADTTAQGTNVLTGAGVGLVSSFLSAKLRAKTKYAPDVIRCEPSTASSGSSCLVGKYVGKAKRIFVGYQRRLAPRADENQNEGVLEWRFTKTWRLQLSGGDGAIFGADVLRRRRF